MFLGKSSLQQINHTNKDQESSNQGYVEVQREREKNTGWIQNPYSQTTK